MTRQRIAVLSTACRFPEAADPAQFWDNIVSGRRSFRAIPRSRLDLAEYSVDRVGLADSIPPILAGLISDWEFDRAAFRIPTATYEATDLTHWLALDTTARALKGMGGADILPKDRTIVVIGDTLTGEFTRSAQLRLRLPYLMRRLGDALAGIDPGARDQVLQGFSASVRRDFPDPNEESLAGALANTIPGRIANHFDLHGGCWSVDGACASSLLSVVDACGRLADGSADVAIVGGVDLSLDPFELVGFARAGALAQSEMRVFDRRPAGFWPGEGCGIAILASASAAKSIDAEPLAWIEGWGVSSDGAGGLTRPTQSGQHRALRSAWQRAKLNPSEARFFEAHGTGTAVGDFTEINALAELLGDVDRCIPVGSVKANIGHCKAAAGAAGLIKTVSALQLGIVPPHVSVEEPNPVFEETGHRLVPAALAELGKQRIAGVSGFGFGGINAHVVVSSAEVACASVLPQKPLSQDAELFLFAGKTRQSVLADIAALRARAASLSLSEMADAAAQCACRLDRQGTWRAAVVAARGSELSACLEQIEAAPDQHLAQVDGVPRVGLIFPGQAAPVRATGRSWARRFQDDCAAYEHVPAGTLDDDPDTRTAQPSIIAGCLTSLRLLERLGIHAEVAVGHSLGELAALCWAGAVNPEGAMELASRRGAAMADHALRGGAMVKVPHGVKHAEDLAKRHGLTIACLNGTAETVLSGSAERIGSLVSTLSDERIIRLKVSHAFHSPDMSPAIAPFSHALCDTALARPARAIVSTVTGSWIEPDNDLRQILSAQLNSPVLFLPALDVLADATDVLIECGPGAGLGRLADTAGHACVSLDVGSESLRPLLQALARLWRLGVDFDANALFRDRPVRELAQNAPVFLSNPCGVAEACVDRPPGLVVARDPQNTKAPEPAATAPAVYEADALTIVREVTADTLGLPIEVVSPDALLLGDLHLNSLSVGRIMSASAERLGVAAPAAATDLGAATVAEAAALLKELADLVPAAQTPSDRIEGVAPWVAEFREVWRDAVSPMSARNDDAPWWVHDPECQLDVPHAETARRGLICLPKVFARNGDRASLLDFLHRVNGMRASGITELAIVHHVVALRGFARSLFAENAFEKITLIDVSEGTRVPDTVRTLLADPRGSFRCWRVKPDGGVQEPRLRRFWPNTDARASLGREDCLLVTGGARGIGAECALRLGEYFGLRLVLVGRSAPGHAEVRDTLRRAKEMGLSVRYTQLDTASADDCAHLRSVLAADGWRPTALCHAAGTNAPKRFEDLSDSDFAQVLAPKVDGLAAMLRVFEDDLSLVVCFGSIIGALGLAGESHYALANDLMSQQLVAWSTDHQVRVLALDWSIWAGAGMGERLGVVERLRVDGVDALPLDAALDRLEELIENDAMCGRVIVTSRFGPPRKVMQFESSALPTLRFVGAALIHYPGVELVVDASLAEATDPWLADHVVDGTAVVPGVLLLEAMAQVAHALSAHPVAGFESVRFDHAITAPSEGVTLRISALMQDDPESVEVVVRASDDGYAADRAKAKVRLGALRVADPPGKWPETPLAAAPLYDALWFNAGLFKRIESIGRISAFSACAGISSANATLRWFGGYAPQILLLGDPGARDAGLHLLQACAPQRRVVPIGVDRVDRFAGGEASYVRAQEIWSDDREFWFDIEWGDDTGRVVERWSCARFHAIGPNSVTKLPVCMLPAVLERAAAIAGAAADFHLVVESGADRAQRRSSCLYGLDVATTHARKDGKPLASKGDDISLSHTAGHSLAVASTSVQVACDLLNGSERLALRACDAPLRSALVAERVPEGRVEAVIWSARECLRKAGVPLDASLALIGVGRDGVVELRGGGHRVFSVSLSGELTGTILLKSSSLGEIYTERSRGEEQRV